MRREERETNNQKWTIIIFLIWESFSDVIVVNIEILRLLRIQEELLKIL